MTDPPPYPASDVPEEPQAEHATSWGARIVIAVGVVLVFVIVILHLTGAIGPATH